MKISNGGKTLDLDIAEGFDHLAQLGMNAPKRATMLMAFGLNAVAQRKQIDLRLPGFVQLMDRPHEFSKTEYAAFRKDFENWVVGNGLRELFGGLEIFLNLFFEVIVRADLKLSNLPLDKGDKQIREFERLGVWQKLRRLEEKFKFKTGLIDHFKSLTTARNCLTHRRGIVHDQDCNKNKRLVLSWLGFDLKIIEADGKETEITLDTLGPLRGSESQSDGDRKLKSTMKKRELSFDVGNTLFIPPRHLEEICFMSGYSCAKLHQLAINWLIESGVPANGGVPIPEPRVEVILETLVAEESANKD